MNILWAAILGLALLPPAGRAGETSANGRPEGVNGIPALDLSVFDPSLNLEASLPDDSALGDLSAFETAETIPPVEGAADFLAVAADQPAKKVVGAKAILIDGAAKLGRQGVSGRSVLENLYDSADEPPEPPAPSGPGNGSGDSEYAYVRPRQEKKEEQELLRKAEEYHPFDYQESAFKEASAGEFARSEFDVSNSSKCTGRRLLELLMTDGAIDIVAVFRDGLDPSTLEMGRFGKSGPEIREILGREKIRPDLFESWLRIARSKGLVYVVYKKEDFYGRIKDTSYYGIPQIVRDALGFKSAAEPAVTPEDPQAAAAAAAMPPLGELIPVLVWEMEGLSPKDADFEPIARVAQSARNEGLIETSQVSDLFWKKVSSLGGVPLTFSKALLFMVENSSGPLFEKAKALCERAVAEKRLDPKALKDALAGL